MDPAQHTSQSGLPGAGGAGTAASEQWPNAGLAWAALALASAEVAAATGDLWQLSDEQLVSALRTEQVAAAQRDSARLALIAQLDLRGYALTAGASSTAAWLAHELLIDPAPPPPRCAPPTSSTPTATPHHQAGSWAAPHPPAPWPWPTPGVPYRPGRSAAPTPTPSAP